MARTAENREVGAWGSTKVKLLEGEQVAKQGFASRKIRWWNWPSGPIVLTNIRFIWAPDRVMGFPAKPLIIPLTEIKAVGTYEPKAIEGLLGKEFAWVINTNHSRYVFGAVARGTNATAEEWVPIVREWAKNSQR